MNKTSSNQEFNLKTVHHDQIELNEFETNDYGYISTENHLLINIGNTNIYCISIL